MPNDPGLDPLAILAALGHLGPARTSTVGGGADTALWRIEWSGQVFALRVFRPEQTAMAGREIAAMEMARTGGLPVPAVHAAGVWQDRPALLLTWMPGNPLAHELTARPWRSWKLGVALGRTQAAIHAIPVLSRDLGQPHSWVDWADPDAALRQCLLERAGDRNALLHLDLHPMNVLAQGSRLTAVLDWANARPGDPRADLARTASILRFAPLPEGMPAPVARAARRMLEAGWRRGYRETAGPIRGMAPFYAWAARVMVNDLSPRLVLVQRTGWGMANVGNLGNLGNFGNFWGIGAAWPNRSPNLALGRQDLPWLTPALLDEVREWGTAWRIRAGLTK